MSFAINKNNIRLQAIGNIDMLPAAAKRELLEAIEGTKNNTRMTLILALSYSSKWEITEAVKNIAQQVKDGKLDVKDIDESICLIVTKAAPFMNEDGEIEEYTPQHIIHILN